MPVMDERLRFVSRLLDGEAMSEVCREFGISRKTGYKIYDRYKEHGLEALSDRSRRPVRYANQLPVPIEGLIVTFKREKPPLGSPQDQGVTGPPAERGRPRAGQEHVPRRSTLARLGQAAWPAALKERRERRFRPGRSPTICGAWTSRGSSSSATASTAIL